MSTLKTPDEIAADTYWLADADSETGRGIRALMAAAIEADRAQRVLPADRLNGARELLKQYDADELVDSPYETAEWLAESLREILDALGAWTEASA